MSEEHSSQSQKRRRPVLFWVFLTIAAPLTVIVLGYASGYSFDPQTQQIVATSALAVETVPKEALIFLNGEGQESSPLYLNEIAAGQHTVRIQKERYQPWEKTVWFEEGKSVIFPDVILFLVADGEETNRNTDSLRSAAQELPTNLYELYQNNDFNRPKKLVYIDAERDIVIDEQKQTSYIVDDINTFENPRQVDATIHDADWHNDVLTYSAGHELWIYDTSANEHTLITRNSSVVQSVSWHPTGGYIFFSDADGVYAIELDGRDKRQRWQLATQQNATQLTVNDSDPQTLLFQVESIVFQRALYER